MRNYRDLRSTNHRCKDAWIVHLIETDGSRDNSELIPEGNQPGDSSATKSVEVNCNQFIKEQERNQLQHKRDSISYLPIQSFDDCSDDARAHTYITVGSPAMPKMAILQKRFRNHARFRSIHIPDSSRNRDDLLQDSMETSTLQKLRRA